jgi:hypothetical protein
MHCIHLQVSDFDEVCGLYWSRCYRPFPFVIGFIVHLMCASAALSVAQAEAFPRDGDEVCAILARGTQV